MTTLKDLQEQVRIAREAAKLKAAESVEQLKLSKQLAYLSSEQAILDEQEIQISEEVSASLDDKIKQLQSAYDSVNAKYRENRDYTYGSHVAALYNILVNTQYAPKDIKDVCRAISDLTDDLVEKTLDSFGGYTYYSVALETVVPGVPADIPKLQSLLRVIQNRMNLSIDISQVDQETFDKAEARAAKRAYDLEKEAMTTSDVVSGSSFVIPK